VRSRYNVPPDYALSIGQRKPSDIAGYDTVPVTLARGERNTVIDFLLSKDGKTLAKLQTFSLTDDAAMHIDVTGRPIRGNPAAKVTVINFDDLECPYCAHMHQALFPGTVDHYQGKVRFIYKDDPLAAIHPWAVHAAVNANCLAQQNGEAYWKFVDYVHAHGQEVNGSDRNVAASNAALDRIAHEQGEHAKVDAGKLSACIARQDDTKVKVSMQEAEALGVEGTPALFVEGERIFGAMPEQQLWMVIDRALRAAGEEPPPLPAEQPAGAAEGTGK